MGRRRKLSRDIGVLAPLVLREISYRLLVGEQGRQLWQIAAGNAQARRVAAAIRWLTDNFARPLSIEAGLPRRIQSPL
jgi:hypothetical protein